jgi:hypothetical protein
MHVMLALMMGAATASPPPPEGHEASPLDGRATASDFDADDSQPASDVALDDDVDDDDNITLLAKDGKGSILNIKTAHAFIPKAEIEEALKGTAAGTSMVWTTTIDRIRFNVIGYKYARFKKVQIFIATVGAVTSDWKPYIAKFKDFQNKTVSRPILRPKVLSVAFTLLNRVDIHNQGRCVNSSHNYIIRILIHSYIMYGGKNPSI